MNITGHEIKSIIRAISSLRTPTYDVPVAPNDCAYDWQLQFYRGPELLGTVDLADCLIRCAGAEYPQPLVIKRLYHRIQKESGEDD